MKDDYKNWSKDDCIVLCGPWRGRTKPGAQLTLCVLCGTELCAYRVTIERGKTDASWHVICGDCANVVAEWFKDEPIRFGGRIRDNKIIPPKN